MTRLTALDCAAMAAGHAHLSPRRPLCAQWLGAFCAGLTASSVRQGVARVRPLCTRLHGMHADRACAECRGRGRCWWCDRDHSANQRMPARHRLSALERLHPLALHERDVQRATRARWRALTARAAGRRRLPLIAVRWRWPHTHGRRRDGQAPGRRESVPHGRVSRGQRLGREHARHDSV